MSLSLTENLRSKVAEWRSINYECQFPAIAEILNYNIVESEEGEKVTRYLRKAQFEALETYWYLRIIENSPHIIDLYKKYFADAELFKALGINISQEDLIPLLRNGIDSIFDKIRNDDSFVKKYRLENVRETITLDYPSYIFALAMGAGKTVLIGSIIATEFAMAQEYPDGNFVKNALVFAPGKTILGALKEISDIPFEKILPPRLYKSFLSSVKVTYTKDGEKDIPIITGSSLNIVVTNTEKIRIQKPTGKKEQLTLFDFREKEKLEEQEEIANLRLLKIASLPHLAIFSDEAHHTYGQSLDKELKKVRKTVDYLAQNTNVLCVINTTGTPYYKKNMLKDVVYWYGLSQGIQDNILKEVRNNIESYDEVTSDDFIRLVIKDFFQNYGDVQLFDGAKAKLAIYFPQTDDLEILRPIVERTLLDLNQDPSIVLEVHNKSPEEVKDLFNNRVNEPHNPYRVFLLVNMGTEGWNCPSLFATSLARKLTTSNNFVLQAATRCLRQVLGNVYRAKIYLAQENVKILDNQLQETFGQSLSEIKSARQDSKKELLVVRKTRIPPILIHKKLKRVVIREGTSQFNIERPVVEKSSKKITYELKQTPEKKKLLSEREMKTINLEDDVSDIYNAAVDLSYECRIGLMDIYDKLRSIYTNGEIPTSHIMEIKKQIEGQVRKYDIEEEEVDIALALVKLEGFNRVYMNGNIVYTAEIMYHKDKEHLILHHKTLAQINKSDFGFHYTPYNFDSQPEKELFVSILEQIVDDPDDIEDIYFTGGIIDPNKTDFLFEYKDKNGKWRNYTPDFVIKKKNGKILIVEVKGPPFRSELKEMAIRNIQNLNPSKLKYEVLETTKDGIGFDNIEKVRKWIHGEHD